MVVKKLVSVVAVFAVSVLVLGATGCEMEGTSEKDQSGQKEEKQVSSQVVYDKVKKGMSRKQVDRIAGGAPDNCIDSEDEFVGKSSTCTYGSVTITFTNGKVDSKVML